MTTRAALGETTWTELSGYFAKLPALRVRHGHAHVQTARVKTDLDRVWHLQQQLDQPRHQLSELVMATIDGMRPNAVAVGLGPWVDMLRARQQAIDGHMAPARQQADAITRAEHPDAKPEHVASAQVIAHHYVGLLEASPLGQTKALTAQQGSGIASLLERHRGAQVATKAALRRLRDAKLAPPGTFTAMVALIDVVVSALHGEPESANGPLHMILPVAAEAPHACECLLAYGLTQLSKGRPERAALALAVCQDHALRKRHRLMGALAVAVQHHCWDEINPGRGRSALDAAWQSVTLTWRGTEHSDTPTPAVDAVRRADRIQRALTFIATHLDAHFTVAEMANVCGVSARTISEDFRAVFHKTVLAYVTEERMRTALTLLQDRSLLLEDVAARVGYQSTFGFSKAFFRTYGHMPPKPLASQ